jgi:hypothetical protein
MTTQGCFGKPSDFSERLPAFTLIGWAVAIATSGLHAEGVITFDDTTGRKDILPSERRKV